MKKIFLIVCSLLLALSASSKVIEVPDAGAMNLMIQGGGVAGGGGGTFTYIGAAYGNDANTETVVTSSSLTIASGDLLVSQWSGYGGDISGLSITCGSNTLTIGTLNSYSNNRAYPAYLLSATSAETTTCTASWTTSRNQNSVAVLQFRPSESVSLDQYPGAAGANGTVTSANVTTSATGTILAVGMHYNDNGDTPSSWSIAGTAADGSIGTYGGMWYQGVVGGTAVANDTSINATNNVSCNYTANIFTFKN